jgi:hypothetical protein|nr:MAG TPA: hypothetical protein [Caudoviricetes sp.]
MTNFEKIKSMSINEMARSCMSFLPVLWKSDSITAVLTAQDIGLKVR